MESVSDAFALKTEFYILRAIQEFTIVAKTYDWCQNAYTNFEYKLYGYQETSPQIWGKLWFLVIFILFFKIWLLAVRIVSFVVDTTSRLLQEMASYCFNKGFK